MSHVIHRIKAYMHTQAFRLILALLFLFMSALTAGILNQVSDTRWGATRPAFDPPLADFFDVLPNLNSKSAAVDALLLSLMGGTVVGMFIISPTWETRGIIFRRLGWVVGLLYLYRGLTISVTTLPASVMGCQPQDIYSKSAAQVVGDAFALIVGAVHTCTDLVYSGHTMVFVTCAIQWRLYCKHKWVAWYVYLHSTAGIFMIIITRFHYTVDCVLGIFVTYGFWSIYMGAVRMAMERMRYIHDHEEAMTMSAWEKDDEDYQRVAYTPRMMNSGLVRIVVWLDALDIRWKAVYGENGFRSRSPSTGMNSHATLSDVPMQEAHVV
jgi:hypothetical protein